MLNDNAMKNIYIASMNKCLNKTNATLKLCWQSKTKTIDQTNVDEDSKSKM